MDFHDRCVSVMDLGRGGGNQGQDAPEVSGRKGGPEFWEGATSVRTHQEFPDGRGVQNFGKGQPGSGRTRSFRTGRGGCLRSDPAGSSKIDKRQPESVFPGLGWQRPAPRFGARNLSRSVQGKIPLVDQGLANLEP